MKIIKYPRKEEWNQLVERPHLDVSQLNATVENVLKDVRQNGDKAVMAYEEKFDHATLSSLAVTETEIDEALTMVSEELLDALKIAHHNISKFHESQKFEGDKVETCKGVSCWQKSVPIEKVGLYIPGGTAPLFSTVLMLATPAKIAGCREIVLCTPPNREGRVNPAILAAARIAGVSRIFKAGGVQAIGAMAYGTESVPKVFKIFGPGNQYVMAAKQQVSLHDVAIDMPAGPSEVCVIADETSHPDFVAADLLSQAEHGIDSQVFLITTSEEMLQKVQQEIHRQVELLPRKDIAMKSLDNSELVLVHDKQEAMELCNLYAPEHLVISTDDNAQLAEQVINAGSVFLGHYACESAGDYASGTNHTLPTHGYAVAYNGVNLDSYVEVMAENEQLQAHRNAMTVRIQSLNKQ